MYASNVDIRHTTCSSVGSSQWRNCLSLARASMMVPFNTKKWKRTKSRKGSGYLGG